MNDSDTLLKACQLMCAFSFDEVYKKRGYRAALKKFCELKRELRNATEKKGIATNEMAGQESKECIT